jgi:hypothetical protein
VVRSDFGHGRISDFLWENVKRMAVPYGGVQVTLAHAAPYNPKISITYRINA